MSVTLLGAALRGDWDDYHKKGILPNIWAGITGQKSAELQTEASLAQSDEQFNKTLQSQNSQFAREMEFQQMQHAQQMDFANRQLADNTRIADQNYGLQLQNYELQKEAYEYQKQLNATQMEREDSAIQRQMKDYASAGLSPLAAIGGNGAGSASLSAGSIGDAPQYDISGINAAAGQYADFARQYSQLHLQASQNYMNNRSQLAQQHNADVLGARMALSQMKSDMHYKGMNAATQIFNSAVNARHTKLTNDYLNEQNNYLKDKHAFETKFGFRDSSLSNAILQFASKIADKYNLGDKVEDKIDSIIDSINNFKNSAPEKIIETGKKVATQIQNLHNVTEKAKKSMILFLVDTMVDQIQRSRELNESQKKEYTNKAKKELRLGL